MFKLSRMTDYAVVVLGAMAYNVGTAMTAPDLADQVELPQPTVAKVLKLLARASVIASRRGAQGGYVLERASSKVSIAEIIAALDGPVALTACVDGAEGGCDVENKCPIRGRWDPVNDAVRAALETVSLEDITLGAAIPDFISMKPAVQDSAFTREKT